MQAPKSVSASGLLVELLDDLLELPEAPLVCLLAEVSPGSRDVSTTPPQAASMGNSSAPDRRPVVNRHILNDSVAKPVPLGIAPKPSWLAMSDANPVGVAASNELVCG